LATDIVRINAENIVWPNQDPLTTLDFGEETDTWVGFELPKAWSISVSLEDIICSYGTNVGTIRTQYPYEKPIPESDPPATKWEGQYSSGESYAVMDLTKLLDGNAWQDGETIEVDLSWSYDEAPLGRTLSMYTDSTHTDRAQPDFFNNSGVKFEQRAEVQIFNTAALRAVLNDDDPDLPDGTQVIIDGHTHQPWGHVDEDPASPENGHVVMRSQRVDGEGGVLPWRTIPVNQLITGLYKAGPSTEAALNSAPTATYMTIEATKAGGAFDFKIVVGSGPEQSYSGILHKPDETSNPNEITLQSHWGSGVVFDYVKVKKQ